jgi:hypothetical protein
LIVNNDSCLLNKTILRFVKYRQATLNVKGSHQRIGITAWDSPQKSHSSPMPRCGEAHAMTVPFTLHKPRSPTTKPILRVLMQTDHRRGAASPSNQSRTRQQSNVPSKRERALKVVSVKLDVPVIQQETWQSHSPPWQCFFFSSKVRPRCALRPHLFLLFVSSPAASPQRIVRIGQEALGHGHSVRRAVLSIFTRLSPRSPPPSRGIPHIRRSTDTV